MLYSLWVVYFSFTSVFHPHFHRKHKQNQPPCKTPPVPECQTKILPATTKDLRASARAEYSQIPLYTRFICMRRLYIVNRCIHARKCYRSECFSGWKFNRKTWQLSLCFHFHILVYTYIHICIITEFDSVCETLIF